jgi:DNA-binding NtrC family response regulator
MPGLTGIQLATALHTLHPALPIVLLTGYGGDWTPEKAAACGICRVASKPISASRLAALIQEVLATRAPGPV